MKFLHTWVFLFFAVIGFSQSPVFKAIPDATEVVTGGYVEVTFSLENAEGTNFHPPSFNGFKVISGPNKSSQVTIVQGSTSYKLQLSYTLLAPTEGVYRIGSASIQAGNRRMASNPFNIKVVKGRAVDSTVGANGLPSADMVFVRAEISDSIAYIGQQIVLKYKLYTSEDIQSYDITSQPDFDGFYVESVKDFRNTFRREVIDGVQYRTRVLKTFALFPQRTGVFDFDPMYLKLGIPFKDKNSRSFFFNTRVKTMPVNTNSVKLEIRTLPEGAPESFSGAVGRFTMRSSIKAQKLSTDDAVVIGMEISGDGDGRKIAPPNFSIPPQFEMYDPKTSKDENVVNSGKVVNYKNFEFIAVPLEPGRFQLTPEFTYFDVDSLSYQTIRSKPYNLNISKGTRPKSESHSYVSGIESMEMRPMKATFGSSKFQRAFYGSKAFIAISSLFLLLFFSIIGFKIYQSNKLEIDPALLKIENANKLALAKLEQAKVKMDNNKERAFYEEIALAFWGYASDKLELDASDLSKEILAEKLTSLNVEEETVQSYNSVLKDCEKVNYAGVANTDMDGFYSNCIHLITAIEEQINQ
jgi:hypothetical protein